MKSFPRDSTQSYIQSETPLERDVYIFAQDGMILPADTVRKGILPFYGIRESVINWFLRKSTHHVDQIGMFKATIGPFGLVRRNGNNLTGLVVLQLDDIMAICMSEFINKEEEASKKYVVKPRRILHTDATTFNGSNFSQSKEGTIIMS